jgi:beta-N-acetylhexosaminidase
MMRALVLTLLLFFSYSLTLAQNNLSENYFGDDPAIALRVDSILNSLTPEQKVAQLIMPAVGHYGKHEDTIKRLIKHGKVGGVLLLNGTKDQFQGWTQDFESLNKKYGNLPFLYSADAEPSLVNRKMKNSTPVKKAVEITILEEVENTANTISDDLLEVGINYNFAPVVDVAKNATVGYRGFGKKEENILPFSNAFIAATQEKNIIATAKHFPGHGLVSGDTHKALQVIDGELKELKYYPPLIANGVLSIMIAHIAVKNNEAYDTDGLPATTSEKIVTELLRDSLGFEGLIVTDAMNMGGVVNVEDCYVKAIGAGCDILLMPVDPRQAHADILNMYLHDNNFKLKVEESVRRIVRMKVALGLI